MRWCQPPGSGRITAPGKVSGSRRFYVIIRRTAWSGEAVATATAGNAPIRTFRDLTSDSPTRPTDPFTGRLFAAGVFQPPADGHLVLRWSQVEALRAIFADHICSAS